MKEGGSVEPQIEYELDEVTPCDEGTYFNGDSGGQDDDIPAYVSSGEFIVPADVVAHLGDGNNNFGANKLQQMILAVRKSKGANNNLPPKAKSLTQYMVV